jgi:transposase-like protein
MARPWKASNALGAGVPRGAWAEFLLEYSYAGQSPEVKQQIVDMAMNTSGIRDTARVLHVSPTTVLKELKKGT